MQMNHMKGTEGGERTETGNGAHAEIAEEVGYTLTAGHYPHYDYNF